MSLFICSKCGCVENHSLINENNKGLGLMDMHEQHKMLCSECNTGTWHGEFEKEHPTDIERAYAELSEYNYTTVFDHCISFEDFEKCYNSNRYNYFKEKLHNSSEQLYYDVEKDELYTEKQNQHRRISSKMMLPGIYAMAESLGIHFPIRYLEPKQPWKETQSEDSKQLALEKARLKRERKAKLKRSRK